MVVGEFKQGKSSLVNAMLNAPVCPVDDDVATSVPTLVRYAAAAPRPPWSIGRTRSREQTGTRSERRADRLPVGPGLRLRARQPGERAGPTLAVEIGLPRTILSRRAGAGRHPRGRRPRLTPHGGHHRRPADRRRAAVRLRCLPGADQGRVRLPGDRPAEACPVCAFVHHQAPISIRSGSRSGTSTPATWPGPAGARSRSSPPRPTLRHKAIESNDKALNLESGYPELVEFVKTEGGRRGRPHLVGHRRRPIMQLGGRASCGAPSTGSARCLEDPRASRRP